MYHRVIASSLHDCFIEGNEAEDRNIGKADLKETTKEEFETKIFIKQTPQEDDFIQHAVDKLTESGLLAEKDHLESFTWIERAGGRQTDYGFWLYPVVFHSNHDFFQLVENAKSLVKLRRRIVNAYNSKSREKIPDKITIGIFGNYADVPDQITSSEDRAIELKRRRAIVLQDNLADSDRNPEISLIGHRFEAELPAIDIFLVPDGFTGSVLYRMWVSTGYATGAISVVFLAKAGLPGYLGAGKLDQNQYVELKRKFAGACEGFKKTFQRQQCE